MRIIKIAIQLLWMGNTSPPLVLSDLVLVDKFQVHQCQAQIEI